MRTVTVYIMDSPWKNIQYDTRSLNLFLNGKKSGLHWGKLAQEAPMFMTARKRSLGQGNIFTNFCHSVHRQGVCIQESLSLGRSASRGVCIQGGLHPGRLHQTLERLSPPLSDTMGYDQRVGGTHPTRMHSCLRTFCEPRLALGLVHSHPWFQCIQITLRVWHLSKYCWFPVPN